MIGDPLLVKKELDKLGDSGPAHERLRERLEGLLKGGKLSKSAKKFVSKKLLGEYPEPWIRKTRDALGKKTKGFLTESTGWDTYNILCILQANMREFDLGATDYVTRKKLLIDARSAAELRNLRAHGPIPTNACLGALDALERLLRSLPEDEKKTSKDAEERINGMLQEAQALVLEARGARKRGDTVAKAVAEVDAKNYNELWLYAAMNDFECKLKEQMGEFMDSNGGIMWSKVAVDCSPTEYKETVNNSKASLKTITSARHWLYHSTSKRPENFKNLISSMGVVLCSLAAIREYVESKVKGDWKTVEKSAETKLTWKWDNGSYTQGAGLPIFVDLQLVNERMSIPLNDNKAFTGRANELKETVEAIVAPGGPGRRILIHGAPGMGKVAQRSLDCAVSHIYNLSVLFLLTATRNPLPGHLGSASCSPPPG